MSKYVYQMGKLHNAGSLGYEGDDRLSLLGIPVIWNLYYLQRLVQAQQDLEGGWDVHQESVWETPGCWLGTLQTLSLL